MRKLVTLFTLIAVISFSAFIQEEKLITKTGHIKFYSHTGVEDITANNYSVTSSLNTTTGDLVFSVPMQSFEFPNATMQKHFNSSKFLDTKEFPKAKFKGKVNDMTKVDFSKDGSYTVSVTGDLAMHGKTKNITQNGTIEVKGGKITATAKFNILLADYKIAFEKGKPSTNIAKEVEATINMDYSK